MKQKLFFAIALGALLFVTGFDVQAQDDTAPLPPPDRGGSIPAPDREGSIFPGADELPPGQTPVRRRAPSRAQIPARGQTPAGGQTPARAQTPAVTPAETPAPRQAQAAPQTPAAQRTPAAPRTPAPRRTPAIPLPARGLFWGGMIGAGATLPEAEGNSVTGDLTFGGGLFVGYDLGLFTGQVEFLFANDAAYNIKKEYMEFQSGSSNLWVKRSTTLSYTGMLFQIPLIVKMDLHLGRLVLQPLGGIYLNFGLGDAKEDSYSSGEKNVGWENPLLGWVAGGTLGLHLGRGFLFWDLRYMSNFGDTVPKDTKGYSRSAILSSLGYQYYFKQR